MKIDSHRLKQIGVAGALAFAGVAALKLSGTAVATPALNFASIILSQTFFEEILVNSGHRGNRDHHDGHGHNGHDDDDAQNSTAHKVRISAKDASDVYIVQNTVPPGGHSGWHTHPGPSIVSIKSGTATVYGGDDPSCAGVTYPAGSGFIDEGGDHVHLVKNNGTEPLVTVAFQIIPHGLARRIDMPDPGFCPF